MSLLDLFEDRGAFALPKPETVSAKRDPEFEAKVSSGRQRWQALVQKILAMDANLEPPEAQ